MDTHTHTQAWLPKEPGVLYIRRPMKCRILWDAAAQACNRALALVCVVQKPLAAWIEVQVFNRSLMQVIHPFALLLWRPKRQLAILHVGGIKRLASWQ
eukprot:scaffold18766_cov19-Tisochrysis_lutea.AAC.4